MVKNHQHGAVGHVKHGDGTLGGASMPADHTSVHEPAPAAKRPRVNGFELDKLLQHSAVRCSATAQEVRNGASFSLTVGPPEDGAIEELHSAATRLLGESGVTSLDTSRLGAGPTCAKALAEALGTNTSLRSLSCERNGLGWAGGVALGGALALNRTLTVLDMSLNDVGGATPHGGVAIAEALKSNAQSALQSLTMVRCGLGPIGGKALGEALETNGTLTTLDLTQNDLGVEGAVALSKALVLNTALMHLNMRFNRIGFGLSRAAVFAEALASNTSLTWLDMGQNEIGATGAAAFARTLNLSALRTLNMARNELGGEGGGLLLAALAANTSLTSLDLSDNELGPRGGFAMAAALGANSTLTRLDASRNAFGAEAGHAIGAALAASAPSSALVDLRLERAQLGAAGGCAIAAALAATGAPLRRLSLRRNEMGAEAAEAFTRVLATNTVLESLDLASNALESNALAPAAASHPTLTWLDLSDNELHHVPIECQWQLARRQPPLRLDLSDNALSSPPLGRRADADELAAYLSLLSREPTAVTRLRLMVLGFGGVGKTTFCAAATCVPEEVHHFHSSLTPLETWSAATIAAWCRGLGTEWSSSAAAVLEASGVSGAELGALVTDDAEGGHAPSRALEEMASATLLPAQRLKLARAIASLLRKGYFSTVGVKKVEGLLTLEGSGGGGGGESGGGGKGGSKGGCKGCGGGEGASVASRECALVDFAGQVIAPSDRPPSDHPPRSHLQPDPSPDAIAWLHRLTPPPHNPRRLPSPHHHPRCLCADDLR